MKITRCPEQYGKQQRPKKEKLGGKNKNKKKRKRKKKQEKEKN